MTAQKEILKETPPPIQSIHKTPGEIIIISLLMVKDRTLEQLNNLSKRQQ